MPKVRYSSLWLWLKYVNREPRVAGMAVGLLFGAMLSPFVVLAASQMPYLFDGRTIQATVVSKYQANLRPGPGTVAAVTPLFAHGTHRSHYGVRYEYLDTGGNKHAGEGRAAFSAWKDLKPGDPVAVRYVRSRPVRSQLESTVWEFWPTIPLGLLSVSVIAGSLGCGLPGVRWVNRQVRLVRFGGAVPGRLTRAEAEYRGKKRKEVVSVLEYEYAAPEPVNGTVEMRGNLRSNWRTGGGIVILVDPCDPLSHAPDIFNARREDHDRLFGRASS